MITEQRIKELVLTSLKNINDSDQLMENLAPNDDTILLGSKSVLDSIAFVNFTTDLEERVENEIGKEFILRLHEIHNLNGEKEILTVGDMAKIIGKLITSSSPTHD